VLLTASYIDSYVGHRMRQRREALGISQGRLGRHLGLTFSQIQKYEKGANRIGAGRLYQISQILGVSPLYFFEGLEPVSNGKGKQASDSETLATELATLAESFGAIGDVETRKSVLALVKSIAASSPAGNDRAKAR
jgi:transcriptional regulator with XRE-family HTH domain